MTVAGVILVVSLACFNSAEPRMPGPQTSPHHRRAGLRKRPECQRPEPADITLTLLTRRSLDQRRRRTVLEVHSQDQPGLDPSDLFSLVMDVEEMPLADRHELRVRHFQLSTIDKAQDERPER